MKIRYWWIVLTASNGHKCISEPMVQFRIAEAQKQTREWMSKHQKECPQKQNPHHWGYAGRRLPSPVPVHGAMPLCKYYQSGASVWADGFVGIFLLERMQEKEPTKPAAPAVSILHLPYGQ